MKKLVVIFLLFHVAVVANCQYYFFDDKYLDAPVVWEAGVSLGLMNSLTDVGGRPGASGGFARNLNVRNNMACGGLFIHGLYAYLLGFRLELVLGRVGSADSDLRGDRTMAVSRYRRNLNFRSFVKEVSAVAEWHFLSTRVQGSYGLPYFFAGLGLFSFCPTTWINGQWVKLHPLRTEGQGFTEYPDRKPYRLRQWNLPVGVGLRLELSALLNLQVEWMHRILFTDYLDDVSTTYPDPSLFKQYLSASDAAMAKAVSDRRKELDPTAQVSAGQQRGNSSNNDSYLSLNLKFSWVFNRKKRN